MSVAGLNRMLSKTLLCKFLRYMLEFLTLAVRNSNIFCNYLWINEKRLLRFGGEGGVDGFARAGGCRLVFR